MMVGAAVEMATVEAEAAVGHQVKMERLCRSTMLEATEETERPTRGVISVQRAQLMQEEEVGLGEVVVDRVERAGVERGSGKMLEVLVLIYMAVAVAAEVPTKAAATAVLDT